MTRRNVHVAAVLLQVAVDGVYVTRGAVVTAKDVFHFRILLVVAYLLMIFSNI